MEASQMRGIGLCNNAQPLQNLLVERAGIEYTALQYCYAIVNSSSSQPPRDIHTFKPCWRCIWLLVMDKKLRRATLGIWTVDINRAQALASVPPRKIMVDDTLDITVSIYLNK